MWRIQGLKSDEVVRFVAPYRSELSWAYYHLALTDDRLLMIDSPRLAVDLGLGRFVRSWITDWVYLRDIRTVRRDFGFWSYLIELNTRDHGTLTFRCIGIRSGRLWDLAELLPESLRLGGMW